MLKGVAFVVSFMETDLISGDRGVAIDEDDNNQGGQRTVQACSGQRFGREGNQGGRIRIASWMSRLNEASPTKTNLISTSMILVRIVSFYAGCINSRYVLYVYVLIHVNHAKYAEINNMQMETLRSDPFY